MALDLQYDSVDAIFDTEMFDREFRDSPTFGLDLDKVVGFAVTGITIPFSYYVIDQLNNTLFLEVWDAGTSAFVTVDLFLSPGTYTLQTLEYAFEEAIGAATFPTTGQSAESWATVKADFTVYMEPVRGRLRLFHRTQDFKLYFESAELANILGFVVDTLYVNGTAVLYKDGQAINAGLTVKYVEAPYSTNLLGDPVIHVHCPELANICSTTYAMMNGTNRGNGVISDLLASIPVNTNYGTLISYVPTFQPLNCAETRLTEISFYLTNGVRMSHAKIKLPGLQNSDYEVTPYLSLNGPSYQINIRFYIKRGETQQGAGGSRSINPPM